MLRLHISRPAGPQTFRPTQRSPQAGRALLTARYPTRICRSFTSKAVPEESAAGHSHRPQPSATQAPESAFFTAMLDRAKRLANAPVSTTSNTNQYNAPPKSSRPPPPKPSVAPSPASPSPPSVEESTRPKLNIQTSLLDTIETISPEHRLRSVLADLLALPFAPRVEANAFRNPAIVPRPPHQLFNTVSSEQRQLVTEIIQRGPSQASLDQAELCWAYHHLIRIQCSQPNFELHQIFDILKQMRDKSGIDYLWPSLVSDLVLIFAAFDQREICELLASRLPDNTSLSCEAHMDLQFLYLRLGNLEKAIVHFDKLVELSRPIRLYKWWSLSLRAIVGAYIQLGGLANIEKAEQLVDEAEKTGLKSHLMASNWSYLGLAFYSVDKLDLSFKYLRKALEHNIDKLPSNFTDSKQNYNKYHILSESNLWSAMRLLSRFPSLSIEIYEDIWQKVIERRFANSTIPARYITLKSMFYDKKTWLGSASPQISQKVESFRRQYLDNILNQLKCDLFVRLDNVPLTDGPFHSTGNPPVASAGGAVLASTALTLASQLNHVQLIQQIYSTYGKVVPIDSANDPDVFSLTAHLEAYLAVRSSASAKENAKLLDSILASAAKKPRSSDSNRIWGIFFIKLVRSDPRGAMSVLKSLSSSPSAIAGANAFTLDRLYLQVIDKLRQHPKNSDAFVMEMYNYALEHRIPLKARTVSLFVATHIELGNWRTALGLIDLIDRMLIEFSQLNEAILSHPHAPSEYVLTVPEYPINITAQSLALIDQIAGGASGESLSSYLHSSLPQFARTTTGQTGAPRSSNEKGPTEEDEGEEGLEDLDAGVAVAAVSSSSNAKLNDKIIRMQEQVRLNAEELKVQAWALGNRTVALALFNDVKTRPLSPTTYFALINSCLATGMARGAVTNLMNLLERNKIIPTAGNISSALDKCLAKTGNDDLAMQIYQFGVKSGVVSTETVNILLKHAFPRPFSFSTPSC